MIYIHFHLFSNWYLKLESHLIMMDIEIVIVGENMILGPK